MTILLTRSPDRAAAMVGAIREAGGAVRLLPLIDFEQVHLSLEPLRTGSVDWLVVSSITTVRALKAAAGGALSSVIPAATRVATIGPSSRRVLEAEGVRVDLAPEGEQSAAGLAALLPDTPGIDGARVWLPQSDLAVSTLADGFASAGAQVSTSVAYRTVDYPAMPRLTQPLAVGLPEADVPTLTLDEARGELQRGGIDAVVGASPSAAEKIAERLMPLGRCAFIAIGNPTARAAESAGLNVGAIAPNPTPVGIVEALQQALAAPKE